MAQRMIQVGEPVPWFVCRSPVNPQFHFDSVAGRYTVLCFFGSAADPANRRVLDDVLACRHVFDDENVCFFGVSVDPEDEAKSRVQNVIPGVRFFWDFDRSVSRMFGAAWDTGDEGSPSRYRCFSLVLDERLRVLTFLPFGENPDNHVTQLIEFLKTLPVIPPGAPAGPSAPVLLVPRIFEPELCRMLIDYYESHGGEESGFMREVGGMTVHKMDYGHKQRRDREILDETLRTATMHRTHDRLVPEVRKAFQFHATRIERYIVACYESETAGHFRPHRDNTTKGTAHRRFAVSLNLNADFEGGNLRFPEFGRQTYKAPVGGAIVFSCSLLHEATAITKGKRYAFLPFLYDDEAAKIRQQNLNYLVSHDSAVEISEQIDNR
jgi:predicted 2-oxoglutarate/Fe(II)-dependent dioxygenase YbiX/peroxiredoxin